MIQDLTCSGEDVSCQADVVIVGAGVAGLALAHALRGQRARIVVIESGPRSEVIERHPLNDVELTGEPYTGATDGRFRCLGGTSVRWGGALLPFQPADFRPNVPGWPGWPISLADLDRYRSDVEALFSLPPGSYEADADVPYAPAILPSFTPRAAKWPLFAKRNIARNLASWLESHRDLQVWVNASFTNLKIRDGRVVGLEARSSSDGGRRLTVNSPATVLAAGAIETTRLMLIARSEHPGLWNNLPIGHGFHDHISAPVANLLPVDRAHLSRTFGFWFRKGGMRNWRLELKGETRAEQRLPGAFAHVAFTRASDGAFGAVRSLLQSTQRREFPNIKLALPIMRELPWLARAAVARLTTGAVLPPDTADFELHLVTEQSPIHSSRISLSESLRDVLGKPLAKIHWEPHSEDVAQFLGIQHRLISEWQASPLISLARLTPRPLDEVEASLVIGGGIYHPAGSTRMGLSMKSSVLDHNLAPHGTEGLWALSTAAFPTCGGANPTGTLLLLAYRLARHLAQVLQFENAR